MKNGFSEVFAGTTIQAEIVKSLLENSEIEAFLKDEFIGTLVPWNAAPGGAGAVKVLVFTRDLDNAKAIVESYRQV